MWLQFLLNNNKINCGVYLLIEFQSSVTLPLPSRLHCHLECPYFQIIGGILKLMDGLAKEDVDTSVKIIQTIKDCLKITAESLKELIEKCEGFWKKREVMERVVNVIEVSFSLY